MSDEKFTKGEWKINKTGPHYNNPELCNIEITYSDLGECVCDTVYEESDAHLIASAPKMYEMLKRASQDCYNVAGFADEIDDLLAQARGES